jgi:steroid delta-isomerase-like uncharacterized protein
VTTLDTRIAQALVDAWNTHDPECILALLTEDHVYEDVTFGSCNQGPAETRRFFEEAFAGLPDVRFALTNAVIGDGSGALEWTMTGTHPQTGKPFSVRGASIFELAGDKLRTNRDYWDAATMMRQVGLLPGEATA